MGVALAVRVVRLCDCEPEKLRREADGDSLRVVLPVTVRVAVDESPCVRVGGDAVAVRDGVADVVLDVEADTLRENE